MWDFVRENLIDEYHVTLTPKLVGGREAPTLVDGDGFEPRDILNLRLKSCRKVGDELYLVYGKTRRRGCVVHPPLEPHLRRIEGSAGHPGQAAVMSLAIVCHRAKSVLRSPKASAPVAATVTETISTYSIMAWPSSLLSISSIKTKTFLIISILG